MLIFFFLAASPRLAVLPPSGAHASKVAEQLVLNALGEMKRYEVIGSSDIEALLGFEKMKDAVGCTDAVCMAQIGGALGADKLLQMRLDALGPELVVSMTLINAKSSSVESRSQANILNEDRRYPRAIEDALYNLFGQVPPTSSLEITSQPSGSEVFVDDASVGRTPAFVARIKPGAHQVRVQMQSTEVVVAAGAPRSTHIVLQSIEQNVRSNIAQENKRSGRIFIAMGLGVAAGLFAIISLPLFLSAGSLDAIRGEQYQAYLAAPTQYDADAAYRDVSRAVSRYNTMRGLGVGMLVTGGVFALAAGIVALTIPSAPVKPAPTGLAVAF